MIQVLSAVWISWSLLSVSLQKFTLKNEINIWESVNLIPSNCQYLKQFIYLGELCGGSLREHCYETLVANIGTISDLEWYLEMRQQGAAQTGGFGLGFERLLQYLIGVENIKDTLPFHRSPHNCSL